MNNRTVGTLTYTAGGLCLLFFWLLFGDFAISIRERAAVPSVLELLRQHHASDTVMSILLGVLPSILGMFLGPVISYKSDRYRSRWGRRIPFLIIPTPIGALAMIGLGFCPWLGAQVNSQLGTMSPGIDFCVLAFFCLFWTIFECVVIMTLAIFAGLINDVVPHGLLGRFFACFRIVSLGAGILFNYWIFKLTETHLFEIFLCVGLFFGIGFTLMCLLVKEGTYPPPSPEEIEGGHPHGFILNAKVYFVECFSHRYYLWIFAALVLAGLAFVPFNMFAQWYADSLGMPKAILGKLTALSYSISIFLAFFIGWLVDRYTALKVGIAMMLLYMLTALFGFIFVKDVTSFGVIYVFHTVVSGSYGTATASLPMVLFPKLRFTQFASASGIFGSLSYIFVSLVQGPLLDYSGHNYRLTLLAGCAFAIIALALLLIVLRNFNALINGEPPAYKT
jgi:MFS family permease